MADEPLVDPYADLDTATKSKAIDLRPVAPEDPYADIPGDMPPAIAPPPKQLPAPYHGALLPFSRDEQGNVSFDPLGAGLFGGVRQAFTLPGRVMSGETPMPQTFDPAARDPNAEPIMGEARNFAASFGNILNPMVRSGDAVIPGVRMAPKDMRLAVTPPGEELVSRGGAQMNAFRGMPIPYNPSYIGTTLATQLEQQLVDKGVFPEHAPGLYQTINRLRDYVPRSNDPSATISVSPNSLISIRKSITNHYGKAGEDQKGVSVVHRAFDDFMANPPAEAVLAGAAAPPGAAARIGGTTDPAAAARFGAQIFEEGLGNVSAGKADAELAAIQRAARLRTLSANSGQNADNSLRSRITSAILNAKKLRGLRPAEEAMLEGVPEGSVPTNLARWGGNFLGGGGGLGAHIATVAGIAGGHALGLGDLSWAIGPTLPAIGAGLKRYAGKSTVQALEEARQAIRQRSPLFQQTPIEQETVNLFGRNPQRQPGVVPDPGITPSPRDYMARELARMYLSSQGTPGQLPVLPYDPNRL